MLKNENARCRGNGNVRKVEARNWRSSLKIITWLLLFVTVGFIANDYHKTLFAEPTKWEQKIFIIRAGETLWDVATQIQADGDQRDSREIIYQIRKDNDIDAYLRPGDRVKVWCEVLDREE